MVREAGLVKFTGSNESRFLGPSSGIAITRLVIELAKQNTETKSIREVVPDQKAQQIKDRFTQEDSPTSKVYPLISDVAAPTLPGRELTDILVQTFNQRGRSYSAPNIKSLPPLMLEQRSSCSQLYTNQPSIMMSKTFTTDLKMHIKILLYAWYLQSACRSWTLSMLV